VPDTARPSGEVLADNGCSLPESEKGAKAAKSKGPGIIEAGACYTLQEFQSRTGIKRAGLRRLRRDGFPVRYCGKLAFIVGADFLDFLRQNREGVRRQAD
jgi:hypothetical protein